MYRVTRLSGQLYAYEMIGDTISELSPDDKEDVDALITEGETVLLTGNISAAAEAFEVEEDEIEIVYPN